MTLAVIREGADAPGFELPGLVDGERRRVALDEFLGRDVVILAFYPADFNPACDGESGLDELDLFTMQKDVAVLAVGPDTLYSHAAFADEYDLHVPLLSDTDHEVARTYGVDFEDEVGQRLVERAVFVVDHDGVVQYAWRTREMTELPRGDEIKDAIADTGGDDTAFARYRVGHAHYTEGRRAFTSAMASYRDSEWMLAQSDFMRAREEFEAAADQFDSSVRFVDDAALRDYYERTQEKATALWQAADWLGSSASEYSSGRGGEGQRLRDDAESPLATARDIGEPVDPDDWPPETDDDGREGVLPQTGDSETSLRVDIGDEDDPAGEELDGAPTSPASQTQQDADEQSSSNPGSSSTRQDAAGAHSGEPSVADAPEDTVEHGSTSPGSSSTRQDTVDDAELEEIAAELVASQPDDPTGEELDEAPTSMVDAPPGQGDDDGGGTDPATDDGDIDGAVGEADLQALEAEMEASQSAADAASDSTEPADGGHSAPEGERDGDGVDDGTDGGTVDESVGGTVDAPGEPAPDPHADLARGSGGSVPGASRSLEPAEGADEEPVLDEEPRGATDADMADIPTTDDLDDASDGSEEGDDGESGTDDAGTGG